MGAEVTFKPVEIKDNSGHIVRFDRPAHRIIALYGAFNELLLALDALNALVGRTAADSTVKALASLPVIGTHMRPNVELIAALQPDLIIQLSGRDEARVQTEHLRSLGFNILSFELNSFRQMFTVTELLGRVTGHAEKAQELTRHWKERLEQLQTRYAMHSPVHVFYEVRYPNLLAAGSGGITNEIITLAGGSNVVPEGKKLVRFSEEALVAANPEAYIIQKGPMNPVPVPLATRAHYRGLRAVREDRVLIVDEELFARPGPRSIDAVEKLGNWLHEPSRRKITKETP